jgi:hypothetical protein
MANGTWIGGSDMSDTDRLDWIIKVVTMDGILWTQKIISAYGLDPTWTRVNYTSQRRYGKRLDVAATIEEALQDIYGGQAPTLHDILWKDRP